MTLRVSGKNMDIGETLRSQIAMRVEQAVRRYFDGGFGGYAVVERERAAFPPYCSLHWDSGAALRPPAPPHAPAPGAVLPPNRMESRLPRKSRPRGAPPPTAATAPLEEASYTVFAAPETE